MRHGVQPEAQPADSQAAVAAHLQPAKTQRIELARAVLTPWHQRRPCAAELTSEPAEAAEGSDQQHHSENQHQPTLKPTSQQRQPTRSRHRGGAMNIRDVIVPVLLSCLFYPAADSGQGEVLPLLRSNSVFYEHRLITDTHLSSYFSLSFNECHKTHSRVRNRNCLSQISHSGGHTPEH